MTISQGDCRTFSGSKCLKASQAFKSNLTKRIFEAMKGNANPDFQLWEIIENEARICFKRSRYPLILYVEVNNVNPEVL